MAVGAGWGELTPRERAVLAAVERRLGNAEIAAEFHVSVRTVESHIAALRRKLATDTRTGLIEAARSRRGSAVAVPQNSFVGREDDLAGLAELLERRRWVTVVGAAGSGKTRLALELAAAGGRAPVVAELEHATSADVLAVIARAVGLQTDGVDDLVAACGVALNAQPYLLIVDNCDRVTDAAAAVLTQLLAPARSLRVLATSRSPLGGAEAVYPLEGLGADGAARLFLDRAGSAAPDARFSGADHEAVDRICRALDGLPLAIELAAARVRHLTVTELAARLEDGLGPLAGSATSGRHSTLEAAFAWTWDLLDVDERLVLSALAALPATFDLATAEAVTTPGTERVLLRLLDRSLVTRSAGPDAATRYRLLNPVRTFVLERTDPAVVRSVRQSHALFVAEQLTRLAARAPTDDSRAAVEAARRIAPDAVAALDWSLDEGSDLALPLARSLAVLVEQYGPGFGSLDAVARAGRDERLRGAACSRDLGAIGMALCFSDVDLAAELAEVALRRATDGAATMAARHISGYADVYRNRCSSGLAHLEVAERLADEQADVWLLASSRQGRGIALRMLGEASAAMAAFESALQSFALAGDAMHVNNVRYMMAATAAESGYRVREAAAWVQQCVDYARETGNRQELAHALLTRVTLARRAGAADSAEYPAEYSADLDTAVEAFRSVGDLRCLTRSYLLGAAGRPSREQVALLGQALDVARRARDLTHQATVLERLVAALWDCGEPREAALALGALVSVVGRDEATRRCPESMVDELRTWETAVAEGMARGVSSA